MTPDGTTGHAPSCSYTGVVGTSGDGLRSGERPGLQWRRAYGQGYDLALRGQLLSVLPRAASRVVVVLIAQEDRLRIDPDQWWEEIL